MQAISISISSLSASYLTYFSWGGGSGGGTANLQLKSFPTGATAHKHELSIIRNPLYVMASSSSTIGAGTGTSNAVVIPKWVQKTVTISPQRRGCHLITSKILKEIGQDLSRFKCGLAHLFLQHTSASLTINENYDSDVRVDTETFLNGVVPEGNSAPWRHTLEGPDDMPAHIKSSMFGCTLSIPITNGKLNMGTWQGIWLCEHRDSATARGIVVTLNGI